MSAIPKVVLLLETSRQYGRQLLRGIARYARLHGPWTLVVSPGHFAQPVPRVQDWGGDAAIVRISSPEMARAIRKSGIPAVALEATLEELATLNASLGISEIRPDSTAIARAAAEHLMERGFRHFAYCGLANGLWSRARQEAFCRHLSAQGFSCATLAVAARLAESDWQCDRTALARWLRELPKPVGLMACNDDLATKVLDACLLAELPVPDEVAIIGVDNDELVCELSDPPLSSVALDLERAGYEAAALLDELMSGRAQGYHEVLVKPRWVVSRRSTDVVAQDDRVVAAALRFIQDNALRPIQ
ncbi:MAG TPA: XylR family transcriptional regulator, partial [Tepidisphaeraceae bacterium]|nr:XylR family transcriptional regulator [Tepidisphaeraceae bacterium]